MTFEHLTDGDFEEFAYDLLSSLGFTALTWRRGSGKGGATADQGRDIVGQKLERDVDDQERIDRWFVQCKHFEKGVPPEKLHGAITWATEPPSTSEYWWPH
jgi:Restriction endonuclease